MVGRQAFPFGFRPELLVLGSVISWKKGEQAMNKHMDFCFLLTWSGQRLLQVFHQQYPSWKTLDEMNGGGFIWPVVVWWKVQTFVGWTFFLKFLLVEIFFWSSCLKNNHCWRSHFPMTMRFLSKDLRFDTFMLIFGDLGVSCNQGNAE